MYHQTTPNPDATDFSVESSLRVQESIEAMRQAAHDMLGPDVKVEVLDKVFDLESGKRIAGKFTRNMILCAFNAHDLEAVLDHEALLFADQTFFEDHEREMLRRLFKPGSELALRVQTELTRRGLYELAQTCTDPIETAAHAFSLWRKGVIDVREPEAEGLFRDIVIVIKDIAKWLRRTVLDQQVQDPDELFHHLATGQLRQRHEEAATQRAQITGY